MQLRKERKIKFETSQEEVLIPLFSYLTLSRWEPLGAAKPGSIMHKECFLFGSCAIRKI